MQTEKLYLEDSYLTEFETNIIDVVTVEDKEAVILDMTAFYPTSGGQMHDTGTIGNARISNVEIKDGRILHFVDRSLDKGPAIGRVDWLRRFDFMQQHTGFHILAQSFLHKTGGETVSSHLGEEMSTIDVQIENIDWRTIAKVEELANSVIWENREVSSYFVEEEELTSLNLRKFTVEERPIRLVDVQDFDLDPCGGTHVRMTGEVGIVKILFFEKVRDCLRFTFVAGERAQRDYQEKAQVLRDLGAVFSTGQEELVHSSQKALDMAKANAKEAARLLERLAEFEVNELINEAEASDQVVVREFSTNDISYLRRLASTAVKRAEVTLLLGQKTDVASIIFATSQAAVNLRAVFSEIQPLFGGKGGVRPDFVQGGGGRLEVLSESLTCARNLVEKQLSKLGKK